MARPKKRAKNSCYYTEIVARHLDKVREMVEAGLSMGDIARHFNVTNQCISEWKNKHPEFKAVIIEAKESLRVEQVAKVESALYRRALGYDTEQVDTSVMTDGSGNVVSTTERKSTRHIPPDQKSIEFFLKNKDPKNWEKSSSDVNIDMGGVLMVPAADSDSWADQVKEQQKNLAQSAKEASEDAIG